MRNKYLLSWSMAIIGLALLVSSAASAANSHEIKIGVNSEPGNSLVVALAKSILEKKLGYKVKTVTAANGIQWQGVASGDLDAMLVAWLPTTQAAYWKKYKNDVLDLGVMFKGKIGLVVPDYIPRDKLDSIDDLKKPGVKKKLHAKITGIEPGAGIMERTKAAIKDYGLDYKLVNSSVAAMVAELARAEQKHGWVVVTGWSPLFIFSKWHLRYLEDPKGTFGITQKIHAIARQGLKQDAPRAATFLTHYKIPPDDLNQAMLEYQDNGSIDKTIKKFTKDHESLINEWIKAAKDKPKRKSD